MDIQQARQLAQNETTAPEKLQVLATDEDYLTRQYVAANPNTPTETLLNICFEFPHEVMNNPVIPLLLLEDPYLLTCKMLLDFNKIKRLIDIEMKRIGWTEDIGRSYLIKNYGKRSRLQLTDKQTLGFLSKLRQM